MLGSAMYPACETLVDHDDEDSCTTALQTYLNEGYCTDGTHCQELASCCPELPAEWQSTCLNRVDLNNDPECERIFGVYQTDGYCGGGPAGACVALDACCQQLDASYYSGCEYYVTAGSQTDCQTMHNTYANAGLCD
jgi:hypothetical protein